MLYIDKKYCFDIINLTRKFMTFFNIGGEKRMWIDEIGFLVFANPFYEGLFINFCVFILSYIAAKVSRERYVYLFFEESRLCSKERMTVEASFFQELTLFYLWKYAKTKKPKNVYLITGFFGLHSWF